MRTFQRSFIGISILLFVLAVASSAQQTTPVARLTLRSAVELSVRNSKDLALAKLQANLADKTAGVDRSLFRPNIYSGSGAAYSSGFPLAPGGGVPAIFELSYTQSLFNPLAKGQQHADEVLAKAQFDSLDSVRDAVMVRTAGTYLELSKVRHSLDLLRKERSDAQKINDVFRQRVAAGYELPIEQTRWELNAARIEQRIAHDEGREDALEDQLRDMLGLLPDQPLELATEDLPQAADRPIAELVAQGLESSPELKQAEADRRSKEELLKGTRAARWPTVDLVGNYSVLSNTNHFTTYFNKFERNNVNVGVQLTIPIYAARASATIALAQTNASAAEVGLKIKRSQVEMRVRGQAHLTRELELGRDVARLDLKLAQQNLQVLQAQFELGQLSLTELERAHLEENDKWLAFLDADFQRQQAELALLQATGQVSKILQ